MEPCNLGLEASPLAFIATVDSIGNCLSTILELGPFFISGTKFDYMILWP